MEKEKKDLINLLKKIRDEKIKESIKILAIYNNRELIQKGIMFDTEHMCYHDYEKLDDVITGLMISADNYGIYFENEFIGIISFFNQYYKDLTRLEVAISIKEEYRNKGIGRYSLEYLLKYYFEYTNYKSIHLSIREDNVKSRKVAEKCGFKLYPGYKCNNTFKTLDGNFIPQVQYLLTKKEYIKK